MARIMIAALAGAMLVASPVLASSPVRPSAEPVMLQPANLQAGARLGTNGKTKSDLTQAGTGAILALVVAAGVGVGIASSSSHSTSP